MQLHIECFSIYLYFFIYCIYFCIILKFFSHLEEFVQTVQSTAGMAVVLLIRSIMGNGDDVPVIVSEKQEAYYVLCLSLSCI